MTTKATMLTRLSLRPARVIAGMLAVSAALALAAGAQADSWRFRNSRSHWSAGGSLVDVRVLVDGETAPLYYKQGAWDRHYFQAFRNRNYSIVVHNNTGGRVGVLLAVDGLNAVNGELSRLSHDEPMYVLNPYETATVRGWRTSLDDVRRFVFVDEERSYAERTDQANGDLGWLRVLSFPENRPWLGWDRIRRESPYAGRNRDEKGAPENIAPAPQLDGGRAKPQAESFRGVQPQESGPTADANPGTGWGDRRHDPVNEVAFDAARTPTDHLVLRYEYRTGLEALGIYPGGWRLRDRDRGQLGFAQPPRW